MPASSEVRAIGSRQAIHFVGESHHSRLISWGTYAILFLLPFSIPTCNFINIGFWNANGLNCRRTEFREFCHDNNLDIALVCETHFSQGRRTTVANYETFNVDRPPIDNNRVYGGTAIYVKHGFNASFIKVPDLELIEATCIVLEIPSISKLLITCIYIPLRNGILKNILLRNLFKITHLPSWGSSRSNPRGTILRRWADQNHAQILLPPEPTYVNYIW